MGGSRDWQRHRNVFVHSLTLVVVLGMKLAVGAGNRLR